MATIHIYTFPSLPNLTAHTTKCNLILKVEQPIFCLSLTFLHDYFLYDLYLISYLSLLLPYMIDVFLHYDYLLLSTFICLLLFTYTTFPCCCCYCTTPLHFEYKITRMPTCRRSDHQKINRKKCTIIKL